MLQIQEPMFMCPVTTGSYNLTQASLNSDNRRMPKSLKFYKSLGYH